MGRRLNKDLIRLFSVFLITSILVILPVIFIGCANPLQDVAKGMVFSEINIKYETEDIPSGSECDFGNIPIESTKSANFTIENLGTADLILFGDSPFIEITGKKASEFSVETPPKSPIAPGSSSTFIISFNPTTAGTKTATIVIKNYDADENPYTIETIGNGVEGPPPSTVTVFPSSPTNDNTPTWSWSEVTGATKYRYSFTDGSNWTETTSLSYTPSSPLADATYTFYVQAYDNSLSIWSASGSASVTIDKVPPTATLINTPSNPTASRSIDITVGGTGVVAYKYKLDSGSWSSERDISIPIIVSSLSLGSHTVSVIGKDAAGNWQTTSTDYSWEIKSEPPPPTVTVFPSSPTNDNTPTWSWSEVSVATKYRYSFTDGSNWTETVNLSYTPTSLSTDGTYTLYVQAYDNSVNVWSSSGSASVTIDMAPPTGTISINSGATYINSTSVTLTISASDSSGVVQMQMRNNNSTWYTYSYTTSKSWPLTSGDGTKYVYVKFKDGAGNWSSVKSDSIILDTIGPSGSVTINSGASETTSPSVTLSLSASDSSGVVQMQIRNNDSTWYTYSYTTSKPWPLTSGDGTKWVIVKFKDGAGNWSSTKGDYIKLDQYRTIKVTFQRIYVVDDGDAIGAGEFYWEFIANGIMVDQRIRDNALSLTDFEEHYINKYVIFDKLNSSGQYFTIYCEVNEADVFQDDYLGNYNKKFYYDDGWGLGSWVVGLSGTEASVHINFKITRED